MGDTGARGFPCAMHCPARVSGLKTVFFLLVPIHLQSDISRAPGVGTAWPAALHEPPKTALLQGRCVSDKCMRVAEVPGEFRSI